MPKTMELLQKDQSFFTYLTGYLHQNDNDPKPTHINESGINELSSCVRIFDVQFSSTIDLVICLGGDGTLLEIGSMFQSVTPPVIAFRLGTLGFLTPFPFSTFPEKISCALKGPSQCILRTRLCCQIIRSNLGTVKLDSGCNDRNSPSLLVPQNGDISSRASSPDTEYHFLNDLVIDRGLSPFLCDLVVKVNGRTVTNIQGDGLIISTPTGSTAYSMTAGASMVHPFVPALVLTPINSLALSSRAIVLPTTISLEIAIADNARCSAVHFSFDGRSRRSNLLNYGDTIRVHASPYSIPCICGDSQVTEWFCGLAHCLNWNLYRHRSSSVEGFVHSCDESQSPCF